MSSSEELESRIAALESIINSRMPLRERLKSPIQQQEIDYKKVQQMIDESMLNMDKPETLSKSTTQSMIDKSINNINYPPTLAKSTVQQMIGASKQPVSQVDYSKVQSMINDAIEKALTKENINKLYGR